MEQDPEVSSDLIDRLDAQGAATRIALWNRARDSVYGMAARCARMVDTMETLLEGPVYHFQSKLTAKEPFVGGAWEWHQDYGY
jgi:ectoine hydroxylase